MRMGGMSVTRRGWLRRVASGLLLAAFAATSPGPAALEFGYHLRSAPAEHHGTASHVEGAGAADHGAHCGLGMVSALKLLVAAPEAPASVLAESRGPVLMPVLPHVVLRPARPTSRAPPVG